MLRQKILLTFYSQSFAQFFSFVSGIIVARLAGPTVMGTLAFGLAFVSMFSFVIDLGLDTAHIKLLSGGSDTGQCNATFTILKACTISLFLLIIYLNYFFQTKILKVKFETSEQRGVIFVWILIVVAEGIISIPRATFIARTERAKVGIPSMLRTISTKSVRIVIAAIGLGAIYLSLVNLMVLLFFIPLYFWLFKKIPFSKFSKGLAKQYIKIAFPMIIILMSSDFYNHIDKLLLQYFSNANEVGYFSVGFSFSKPIKLFGVAVSALFFPTFTQLFSENKTRKIMELVTKYERFLFLFVFPFVVLFMIYSPTFVPLFLGEKYINSIQIASLISLAMFIYILQLPYGNMILSIGKFKQAVLLNLINLISFIIFIFIFVSPKFFFLGAKGNTLAIIFSNLFFLILLFLTMKKYIKGLKFFFNRNIMIVYLIIFILFYFVYKFISLNKLVVLIYIYPFFFILFFFGFMSLIKLITKKDWDQFLKLFRIKDLLIYVKNEFKS